LLVFTAMPKWASILVLVLGCSSVPTPARDIPDPITSGPDAAVDVAVDVAGDVAVPAPDGNKKSPSGGGCRSTADCQVPQDLCHEPAAGPYRGGGGDAFSCKHECDSDQQCALSRAGYICLANPVGSDCRTCEPSCAQLACDTGQSCQPDGRCVTTTCRVASDCPANFDCSAAGACVRRRCSADGDCQGVCVNGACHPTPGMCYPPAA
jgi:hypothetical protein